MDAQLVEFIRELSLSDTKSLSQKVTKTGEEFGELCRAINPFENAFATTHRFVDPRNILEECADVILCAMSISNDVGFTHDELCAMMLDKAGKWQGLQAKSARVTYPVPFEIHITIAGGDVEQFKTDCADISVKPLLLDLQSRKGGSFRDLQTSSKHLGTNRTAYEEVQRIAGALRDRGYEVVREKIETVPWHPMAPSQADANPKMPKNCYFECHFGVNVHEDDEARFRDAASRLPDLHVSRNVFKKSDNGTVKIMLTGRDYETTYEHFKASVDIMLAMLNGIGLTMKDFSVDKPIVEFSVYDTKISHDKAWLA